MILVDHHIREAIGAGKIMVSPYDEDMIQPSSYDFHLGSRLLVFNPQVRVIDTRNLPDDLMVPVDLDEGEPFELGPGQFALAGSVEWWTFAPDLVCQINGKSSLGRLGLQVHATAGFFDPGWDGIATMELSNVSPLPLLLWPGQKIAQMVFMKGSGIAERPYGHPDLGSKYAGASSVLASRFDREANGRIRSALEASRSLETKPRRHRGYYAGQEHGMSDPWAD